MTSEGPLSFSYGTAKKFQIIIIILQFSLMEVKGFHGADREIFLSNNLYDLFERRFTTYFSKHYLHLSLIV